MFHSTDDLCDTYHGLLAFNKTGAEDSGTAFLGASKRGNITLYTCVFIAKHKVALTIPPFLMNWAYRNYNRVSIQLR